MGILDSMFGGGGGGNAPPPDQSAQGPQSPGILGRMQAQYAPGAYAAKEQALQQQAIYHAALQTQGVSPQIAQALAMSPQYLAQQGGAHLPAAPQIVPVTNSDGGQTLYQANNPGGAGGHGTSIAGIPITEPPGTTTSPQGASGAQGATQVPDQGQNAPAGSAGPRNTSQGMPGSTTAIEAKVQANIAAGVDPFSGLPDNYRNAAQAVMDGRMTLSEIKQTRNEHIAGTVRNIVLKADPNFNELKNEKTAAYVKSYMDTKTGDVGFSRNALGTSLQHIDTAVSNQLGLNNNDAQGIVPIVRAGNMARNTFGENAPKAAQQDLQLGTAADELAKFITGKPPTDASRGEYRDKFPSISDPPRVAAAKYNAMADLLEGRMKDMETERDQNFGGKKVAKDYPIVAPEHMQLISNIREKAAELKRRGEFMAAHPGETVPPVTGPAASTLPPGWKFVK